MTTWLEIATLTQTPQAWWTERHAGLYGGLAGTLTGIWGGLIGAAAGLLLPKGRGRPTVRALVYSMIAFGLMMLTFGIIASSSGQPDYVQRPLFMIARFTILTGVLAAFFFELYLFHRIDRDRLEAEELRRS